MIVVAKCMEFGLCLTYIEIFDIVLRFSGKLLMIWSQIRDYVDQLPLPYSHRFYILQFCRPQEQYLRK